MNKSTDRQKKDSGKGLGFVVVIAVLLFSSLAENMSGRSLAIIVAAAVVVGMVFAGVYAAKKLSGSTKGKTGGGLHPYAPNSTRQQESCGYSAANCEYSHEMERRREQLDSFLKNGIIGKDEYRIMLEKYEKNIQSRMQN